MNSCRVLIRFAPVGEITDEDLQRLDPAELSRAQRRQDPRPFVTAMLSSSDSSSRW